MVWIVNVREEGAAIRGAGVADLGGVMPHVEVEAQAAGKLIADFAREVGLLEAAVEALPLHVRAAGLKTPVQGADGTDGTDAFAYGAVAAGFSVGRRLWFFQTPAAAGDDVDHAAHGAPAIEAGSGTAQHFDALHVVERHGFEIEGTGEVRGQWSAIDHQGGVLGGGAACQHGGHISRDTGCDDGHAGDIAQGVRCKAVLLLLDFFSVDDRDAAGGAPGFCFRHRRGDDDFGNVFGWLLFLGRRFCRTDLNDG